MTKLTEAEWHEIRVECAPPTDYGILRGLVEAAIAARLAPIRALADEWADADHEPVTRDGLPVLTVTNRLGRDLRAALDATGADLSASQDHDGAEGQGEGERAGEAHADGCGTCHGLVWCPVCEDEREAEHWSNEWKKAPNE